MFSQHLGSSSLSDRCRKLASHHGADPYVTVSAQNFSPEAAGAAGAAGAADAAGEAGTAGAAGDEGSLKLKAVLSMAHGMGPSPAQVASGVIQQAKVLEPKEVIELATFLGVLQLLHRLTVWRAAL